MYKCKKLFTGEGGEDGVVPSAVGNTSVHIVCRYSAGVGPGVSVCVHVTLPLSSLHSCLYRRKKKSPKSRGKPGWVEMGVGNQASGGGVGCCPQTHHTPPAPLPCPVLAPIKMLLCGLPRMLMCIVRWFARGLTGGC